MSPKILVSLLGLLFAIPAFGQEYGFVAGVHQTGAETDIAGTSIDGKFNFKLGLAMGFELLPQMRFRTGTIYSRRYVEFNASSTVKERLNYDYIDVPVNFQYNFNDMVGVFGGLVVGINISDKVDSPLGVPVSDRGTNGLIPLADLGLNFLFEDMIGFDLYFERGLGKFAENWKNFNTFGGNFIYWF